MTIPQLLCELAQTRRLYAAYAADPQAVLSGWAAHVFSRWVLLYRECRAANRPELAHAASRPGGNP